MLTRNSDKNLVFAAGFSNFEKSAIEAFLRLAESRAPHWKVTYDAIEAAVILLNAASRQDVDAYRSTALPEQKIVLVGDSDFGTGWMVLPRPMRLTNILSILNAVIQAAPVPAPVPVAVAVAVAVAVPAKPLVVAAPHVASQVSLTEASKDASAASITPLVPIDVARGFAGTLASVNADLQRPQSNKTTAFSGHVLLVDDSDVALKFMHNRLKHFGYESHLARSGEEALTMLAAHDFQFVFLDVMMAGLDGYQTCRAIKQNKARRGPPPVVVMLTSKGGTIDKIRGSMAGCDGYLTKPLNERHLASVLAKFDDSTVAERFAASSSPQPMVSNLHPNVRTL